MKSIRLDTISFELSPMVRVAVNQETVEEYAECYRSKGHDMPEPQVFVDADGVVRLADGRHRVEAAMLAGLTHLQCEVGQGGYKEALRAAAASNMTHGLRRTNADKRLCVELGLREWPNLSSAEIGRICCVSHTFVEALRTKNQPATNSGCRLGADGKERKMPKKEKPMGASQCGPHEHVIPPEPPSAPEPTTAASPVPASPLIADKVNQIVREALRLQTPNGPEAFFSPPFRHLLAQLVGLQKMIQPPLPGMEEHLAEPSAAKKARATLPEIIAFVTSSEINLPESDAKAFFYHMESQGWKVNRMAVKDWKMTVRKWQEYGYMASQKRAQNNGHGKPQETHWKTKELDAELAQLRKEEAEFEKRSAALRRPK